MLTEDIDNVRQSFLSTIRRLPVRIVTGRSAALRVHDDICQGVRIWLKPQKFVDINVTSTVLASGEGGGTSDWSFEQVLELGGDNPEIYEKLQVSIKVIGGPQKTSPPIPNCVRQI